MNDPPEQREISLAEADNDRLANFAGPMEQNLRHVEDRLGVDVRRRGHRLQLSGPSGTLARAEAVLRRMFELSASEPMTPERVHLSVQELGFPRPEDGGGATARADGDVEVHTQRGAIRGRGPNQRRYLEQIRSCRPHLRDRPGGHRQDLSRGRERGRGAADRDSVRRIVLVRPAVEAGERLGFLPGDMAQKVDPYLRPMYDALYEMLGFDRVARAIERQIIEVAPLAFMRGRSLNDSFIILDEAQNTTVEQMKMFLTRIGFGSKTVVTGDITQIDLPRQQRSGLKHVIDVLRDVEGVAFTFFSARDVVRHPLVQRIVLAYERDTDGGQDET